MTHSRVTKLHIFLLTCILFSITFSCPKLIRAVTDLGNIYLVCKCMIVSGFKVDYLHWN